MKIGGLFAAVFYHYANMAEELAEVYTRGNCPALDCWLEDI